MSNIHLFTIGFTKTSAQAFFDVLHEAGVRRLIDVRLNNSSQLSGFAKRDDLAFFLKALHGIEYAHIPQLAPTQEILDDYKKNKGPWSDYERKFIRLLRSRHVESSMNPELFDRGCLLCSEDEPTHCHRRLVADYLKEQWRSVSIEHLLPSARITKQHGKRAAG